MSAAVAERERGLWLPRIDRGTDHGHVLWNRSSRAAVGFPIGIGSFLYSSRALVVPVAMRRPRNVGCKGRYLSRQHPLSNRTRRVFLNDFFTFLRHLTTNRVHHVMELSNSIFHCNANRSWAVRTEKRTRHAWDYSLQGSLRELDRSSECMAHRMESTGLVEVILCFFLRT